MTQPAAAAIVRRGLRISAVALAALAGVYVLALGYTPVEARQGLAQKIFYLHVPAAWTALLSFSLVGLSSALYLWLRDARLDRFAELMLPVLLLPFMVPPLIGAVQATARLLAERPLSEVAGWLRLLALYDVVFVTLCMLAFPAVVDE